MRNASPSRAMRSEWVKASRRPTTRRKGVTNSGKNQSASIPTRTTKRPHTPVPTAPTTRTASTSGHGVPSDTSVAEREARRRAGRRTGTRSP